MTTTAVLFRVDCSTDDPQVLARVLGVFAARGIVPRRFSSLWIATPERIEIEVELASEDNTAPDYLARVLDRIPTVDAVQLFVNGEKITIDPPKGC